MSLSGLGCESFDHSARHNHRDHCEGTATGLAEPRNPDCHDEVADRDKNTERKSHPQRGGDDFRADRVRFGSGTRVWFECTCGCDQKTFARSLQRDVDAVALHDPDVLAEEKDSALWR